MIPAIEIKEAALIQSAVAIPFASGEISPPAT
jgi:hypothetical protein